MRATLGGVTTYYIGNHFEWRGSTSTMTRYYYADGQRVAMRVGSNAPSYLLGDHLGSTSVTASSSGGKVAELRYHPWGGTRFSSGTTPTARRYTGQIEDAAIGLYFYNARYYDPLLGRFIQADTIIPNPANPQSLNRYAYTLNHPLRYTDPSGHFEEDEIDRYLEFQLGITDADERLRVITSWKNDKSGWWSIIGPGGATYGDVLDGIEMLFGYKTGIVRGLFVKDETNMTFRFVMERDASIFNRNEMNSLVDFHRGTQDILWLSRGSLGNWIYRGGTGFAADGARIDWKEGFIAAKHTAYALAFAAGGITTLSAPEPTMMSKALAVISFVKCGEETIKANAAVLHLNRSIQANSRLANWVD